MKTKVKQNRVYGIIGMVALFLVGTLFGYVINGTTRTNHSTMTKKDCNSIAYRIIDASKSNRPELIGELNKVYSENCVDRVFDEPKQKKQEQKFPEATCEKIEILLEKRLYPENSQSIDNHIDNAKIYANLSERGCAQNSEKYKTLAKQELEIARALNDDSLYDESESVEIVETYKRLQMQAEAERMIEKAKKLTNPAIDFIIQLEKIIEE